MDSFFQRAWGALFLIWILGACGEVVTTSSKTDNSVPEPAYCAANSIPVSGTPVTITGLQANYSYYPYLATNPPANLSTSLATRGIPFAEVVITNSSGTIVQCSETNASGSITNFQIPKVVGTYTVTVRSRAFNSKARVSVLNDITSNSPYGVTTTFTIDGSEGATKTVASTILASGAASPNREGAAFHILYNLYLANEYLRTELANPSFVTEKVTAYWKNGFNPGSYVGTSSGLSFYIQGSRELYILGGSNGNSTSSDTDHWDDSVILHEFGHFLEDVYSRSDSPGGSHNGNFIIDPRLAWSEGWANFFQGAVIRSVDTTRGRYYVDTINGSVAIRFDMGADGGAAGTMDRVTQAGEGTFREVSVSRTLWKTIVPAGVPTAPAGGSVPFIAIWEVFTDTVNGLRNPLNFFRNIGLFSQYLNTKIATSYPGNVAAWNAILVNEWQNTNTKDYANPVSASDTCTTFTAGNMGINLSPVIDGTFASLARSNLLRSNDFYLYYYAGGGGSISMSYSTTAPPTTATNGTNHIDLDLYLYQNGYLYQEDALEALGQSTGTVAGKSDRQFGVTENGTESISLGGLAPGYYLLNVKANTFNRTSSQVNGTARYTLQLIQGSTQWLCPQF
ncbi:MAG: carboxypeptidase-like regulatory domain-containing protein [Bdellovibrionales bacterium]